jgi:GTPase SAR1 family protein
MATNNKERIQKSRKLIITGDSMCGKRTLLCAFETNQFDDNCDLSIFDTPLVSIQVDGKTVS